MAKSRYKEVEYSKSKVKRAGRTFTDVVSPFDEKQDALIIINNWRAAHAFPLQIIYCHVKKTAGGDAIVAQRLKRLQSITNKLKRFPNMGLCTMQDIGGCRVIVSSVSEVYNVIEKLKKSSMRHKLREEYDYIKSPKDDGYRSYHITYSYHSDRNEKYNGLLIEIQVRTHIQHLWATAVETMDVFTGEALKNGLGSEINKQFFKIASKLLELYEISGLDFAKVKSSTFADEMRAFDNVNHVINRLATIRATIQTDEAMLSEEGYFLLQLDSNSNELVIKHFLEVDIATSAYDDIEKIRSDKEDIVLVSTLSFDSLKKAYPNYFNDISEFHELMLKFMEE